MGQQQLIYAVLQANYHKVSLFPPHSKSNLKWPFSPLKPKIPCLPIIIPLQPQALSCPSFLRDPLHFLYSLHFYFQNYLYCDFCFYFCVSYRCPKRYVRCQWYAQMIYCCITLDEFFLTFSFLCLYAQRSLFFA